MYREKHAVKMLIILFLFFVSASCTFDEATDANNVELGCVEKYRHSLNALFNYEWTLISVEEKSQLDSELCHCGLYFNGMDDWSPYYTEWTIEYHDGNGVARHFVFTDRFSPEFEVTNHIRRYIARYYMENFVSSYIDESLPIRLTVMGHISRPPRNSNIRVDTWGWRERVSLTQLTPANVFEVVPYRLGIHIRIESETSLGRQFEESLMGDVENLIESMNYYANNRLTAMFMIGYDPFYAGDMSYRLYYIQGERVTGIAGSTAFDIYFFENYKEMFWQ